MKTHSSKDLLSDFGRAPSSVMWIGVHPDDEVLPAPLLARWCVEGDARGALLVASRGDGGSSFLPEAQGRLDEVRPIEMREAADVLGMDLIQWDWGDVGAENAEGVVEKWGRRVEGVGELKSRLAEAIREVAPDVILTFDPRHGTTFHPAHMAMGRLVVEVVATFSEPRPRVYLVASRIERDEQGCVGLAAMAPEDPNLFVYDASERLPHAGRTAWSYAAAVARPHRTQLPTSLIDAMESAPENLQKLHFIRLDEKFDPDDALYQEILRMQRGAPDYLEGLPETILPPKIDNNPKQG